MEQRTFNLLITDQGRVLLGTFIFSAGSLAMLFSFVVFENVLLAGVLWLGGEVLLIRLLTYFSAGRLTITAAGSMLRFRWKKKPVFNFRNIPDIQLKSINRIVVDEGPVLRKLFTSEQEITLGGMRPNKFVASDNALFIDFVVQEVGDIEIMNSWDLFFAKGYGRWAYWINLMALLLASGTLIFALYSSGIKHTVPLLLLTGGLASMVSAHFALKKRMM